MILIAGGAYLVYEYFYGTTPAVQSTSSTAPVINSVSGSLTVGQAGSLTVTVSNVTGSPAFFVGGVQVTALLTGTAYVLTIPASLVTGTSVGLGVTASNGSAATMVPVAAASGSGSTSTGSGVTPTGAINGFTYTDKTSYMGALTSALNKAAGGATAQTLDVWNAWA